MNKLHYAGGCQYESVSAGSRREGRRGRRDPTRRRAAKRNSAGGCRHALPFPAAASAWPRKRTRRTSRADDDGTSFAKRDGAASGALG